MREGCSAHNVRVHAYVFMHNHFHLLATPDGAQALSRAMKWVTGTYSQWYNCKYRRSGTLWEGRYWAAQVDSEAYFLCCSSYVELNPVRAGIVAQPSDYLWSSCRCHALGATDPLVAQHEIYLRLGDSSGERASAHAQLLQAGLDWDTEFFIREATRAATSMSTGQFLRWKAKKSGGVCKPATGV